MRDGGNRRPSTDFLGDSTPLDFACSTVRSTGSLSRSGNETNIWRVPGKDNGNCFVSEHLPIVWTSRLGRVQFRCLCRAAGIFLLEVKVKAKRTLLTKGARAVGDETCLYPSSIGVDPLGAANTCQMMRVVASYRKMQKWYQMTALNSIDEGEKVA